MIMILLCIIVLSTVLDHVFCRVLVIGATGRVGSAVVSNLRLKGIPTNVLVRNIELAKLNENLTGCNIFQGDVCDTVSLIEASKDCDAIVAVHGAKPPRFAQFLDLVRTELNHPYNINYLGTKRILAAMGINKIDKLVRITGALVDKNPFHPFVVLLNLLLSNSIKWNQMGEKAIREANINYTVIRPTGINASNTIDQPRKLVLLPGDGGEMCKLPGQITVNKLAELCVLATTDSRLSKATVICSSDLDPLSVPASSSVGDSVSNISQDWDTLLNARKVKTTVHELCMNCACRNQCPQINFPFSFLILKNSSSFLKFSY